MKITLFNGSPRMRRGVTWTMAEHLLAGARDAGADVEHVLLARRDIRHCTGCFACWFRTPGSCALSDDMASLLEAYMASDIVVFAGPLYVGTVSGVMKDFIDRMLPLYDPRTVRDDQGRFYHLLRHDRYPDVVVMGNGGLPERTHVPNFESIFDFMQVVYRMRIIARIFLAGGFVLQGYVAEHEAAAAAYLDLLRRCGREIVERGGLTDELIQQIAEPLVDIDAAVAESNRVFDALVEAAQTSPGDMRE